MREHRKAIAAHGAANYSIELGLFGLGRACLAELYPQPLLQIAETPRIRRIVHRARRHDAAVVGSNVASWLPQSSSPASTSSSVLLVRTTVGLIRWAIVAIRGRSAKPIPMIGSIPLDATERP